MATFLKIGKTVVNMGMITEVSLGATQVTLFPANEGVGLAYYEAEADALRRYFAANSVDVLATPKHQPTASTVTVNRDALATLTAVVQEAIAYLDRHGTPTAEHFVKHLGDALAGVGGVMEAPKQAEQAAGPVNLLAINQLINDVYQAQSHLDKQRYEEADQYLDMVASALETLAVNIEASA